MAARTLTQILRTIEDRLYDLTPRAIRAAAARQKSPVWCCGLVIDSSVSPYFPPELAVATIAERDETLRKQGKAFIWKCTTFDGLGAAFYEDARLDTVCEEANERLAELDVALPAQKLIVRLAKRLNALPSKSFGKVADELTIFAFDRNEKTTALVDVSLTAPKRAALKRLRLL